MTDAVTTPTFQAVQERYASHDANRTRGRDEFKSFVKQERRAALLETINSATFKDELTATLKAFLEVNAPEAAEANAEQAYGRLQELLLKRAESEGN